VLKRPKCRSGVKLPEFPRLYVRRLRKMPMHIATAFFFWGVGWSASFYVRGLRTRGRGLWGGFAEDVPGATQPKMCEVFILMRPTRIAAPRRAWACARPTWRAASNPRVIRLARGAFFPPPSLPTTPLSRCGLRVLAPRRNCRGHCELQ